MITPTCLSARSLIDSTCWLSSSAMAVALSNRGFEPTSTHTRDVSILNRKENVLAVFRKRIRPDPDPVQLRPTLKLGQIKILPSGLLQNFPKAEQLGSLRSLRSRTWCQFHAKMEEEGGSQETLLPESSTYPMAVHMAVRPPPPPVRPPPPPVRPPPPPDQHLCCWGETFKCGD